MVFLGAAAADLAPRRAASGTAAACILGAAAGILFGVSDISIKALTGHGPRRAAVDRQPLDARSRSSPRSPPSTPPPAACRSARASR